MSINKNYMQKIKYVFATAFFAFALAFIAMPTATFASYGDEISGDVGYEGSSGWSDWSQDYTSWDYSSPTTSWGNDYTSWDYSSPTTSWGNDYTSYDYSSPTTSWGNDYTSTSYSTPSTNYGCSNCGGSYSTPSYSTPSSGCSNCGVTSGYSVPSYSTGYGCTNCGGSNYSTPSYGCTNCGGSSIPSYSTGGPSLAYSNSTSNPTNTSTNTNPNTNTNNNTTGPSTSNATTGPSTSNSSSTSTATGGNSTSTGGNATVGDTTATGGAGGNATTGPISNTNTITNNPVNNNTNSASTSVNVSLVNNSPSTATATNNSTTTVNVINNIVVNVPSGYPGPYVPPTNPQNDLIVSCSINPSYNVQIGQDVSFFANATGGNGNYQYSWTGSDGLNSSSQSFTGRFYSAGSKFATVTVYSNGQSRSQTCNTNVGGNNNGNLSAYCTATPSVANTNQYVTWSVYPTGGNGNYSYQWSGSDGLYGNNSSVTQSYGSTGYKTANVTVYSNGQSITANCNANINAIYGYQTQASNVTLIKGTSDQIGTASGIYLGQLPATGISLSMKVVLFAVGLLMWSLFAAFVVSKRKKATGYASTDAIADFKARMLAMKNR